MTQIILIFIGVVIVAFLLTRKGRALLRVKLRTGTERVVGICATAIGLDAKKLERVYMQKLTALDELKKSVLKKAFSGKL